MKLTGLAGAAASVAIDGATWTIFELAVDMGILFVVSHAHCAKVHNAKMHNAKMDNEKENRT